MAAHHIHFWGQGRGGTPVLRGSLRINHAAMLAPDRGVTGAAMQIFRECAPEKALFLKNLHPGPPLLRDG